MYELSERLMDYGIRRPEIQAMLDLAAEVIYLHLEMLLPENIGDVRDKMFIMLEFGFRRQQDTPLTVDKKYFEALYDRLEKDGWH